MNRRENSVRVQIKRERQRERERKREDDSDKNIERRVCEIREGR